MATDGQDTSVNGWNIEYVESLYHEWKADPERVEPHWRQFFSGFDLGVRRTVTDAAHADRPKTGTEPPPSRDGIDVAHTRQRRVDSLIYHYRDIGHLAANIDPLERPRPFPEQLTLESFALTDEDLTERFDPGQLPIDNPAPLSEIVRALEDTYCREIGVEYMHIQDRDQRRWLQKRMETVRNKPAFEKEHRLRVLKSLQRAAALENFLDKRYMGKKWFSLSGADSLIPMLDEMVELGPLNGIEEYTLGMAHRGRAAVLVCIFNRSYDQLFTDFEESWVDDYVEGGGDVKYHRGYSCDRTTLSGHAVHLTMASNPSHLEFVNPVVLGRCRAKQRLRRNEENRDKVAPIIIHGDAAFAGQGIVAECFNMARLKGYRVGGTLHIIINNQLGFTTEPDDGRSGRYCSDLAKMIEAPIFHVNGDDPEACAYVARLAVEYRQAFHNDVVIDLCCYRKYGHNEVDEPAFTQPLMYDRIRKKTPVVDLYSERLAREGVVAKAECESLRDQMRDEMDQAQTRTKEKPVDPAVDPFAGIWSGLTNAWSDDPGETGTTIESLRKVARALGSLPDGFEPHSRLKKLIDARGAAIDAGQPLDWAMGELLAYGTLLLEGHAVRLTGQDVERGTFSHRHSVIVDAKTGAKHTSLSHIADGQARFCVHNSPLSEQSCMGYEYGYSLADPKMLILWEAQFGDFANGAQVIIDQFIASAEFKWQRLSGLVLLLPHGCEGQGPEHSSARLERFLQLCADNNMQVVFPTTPAQIFHVLRRQLKRNFRKPLIVMTPKSMLRHKEAVSTADELISGRFRTVLDDSTIKKPHGVTRLIFCTGKIYYELAARRAVDQRDHVALVRVEQLYPFPKQDIAAVLSRYSSATEVLWVQEEPLNGGAYRFFEAAMREELDVEVSFVGREASPSPAVGSSKMHEEEQAEIIAQAFAPFEDDDGEAVGDNGTASPQVEVPADRRKEKVGARK